MDTKQSKVTVAQFVKTYTGKYGTMFIHDITFENDDKGQYLSKEQAQTSFKVGEVADYTKEEKQNGEYTNISIKPVRENKQGSLAPAKGRNESFALSYAKDIACAYITKGAELGDAQMLVLAEKLYVWLESKNK